MNLQLSHSHLAPANHLTIAVYMYQMQLICKNLCSGESRKRMMSTHTLISTDSEIHIDTKLMMPWNPTEFQLELVKLEGRLLPAPGSASDSIPKILDHDNDHVPMWNQERFFISLVSLIRCRASFSGPSHPQCVPMGLCSRGVADGVCWACMRERER